MKPVAIFRHSPGEGPGYFADFLNQRNIPWTLIAIDLGDPVPVSSSMFSGLCFMGGAMSVNDPLPWIAPICSLIRSAMSQGIPVIGHCLGGQLMSKALGGQVTHNPVKEIGWSLAKAVEQPDGKSDIARFWLGDFFYKPLPLFQWHGETFSLPDGAVHLFANEYCTNQAFAIGPHLGLQCHVEMTIEMINTWSTHWEMDCAGLPTQASIQTPEVIKSMVKDQLPALHAFADQLYSQWIRQLSS